MRNPALGCAKAMGIRTIMNATAQLRLVALLCTGLTGCVAGPALFFQQGGLAGSLLSLVLPPVFKTSRSPVEIRIDHCLASTDKGITVTEPVEMAIPTDEGLVTTFALADWRAEIRNEGYPPVERSKTPIEGTLAVAERSVALLTARGSAGVRIPYDLVEGVDAQTRDVIGEPSSVIVKSCFGRVDIFTLWQDEPTVPDPEAAKAAAAKIREGVAGFRAAADSAAQVQK